MLQLESITRAYGRYEALKGLSCTVGRGQIVGLLGTNGAGKSTAMNIIAGYLAPTSGRVLWDGQDVRSLGGAYLSEVGFMPETPPLYPELTVREQLEYVCSLRRIRLHKRSAHIRRLCEMTDVADRLNTPTRSLSKGYKQRVGLAQALIGNPSLIVLDEPTSGLDPEQIVSIRSVIRELGRDHALILSSHILSEIEDVCASLIILRRGEMVACGTQQEIAKVHRGGEYRVRVRAQGEAAAQAIMSIPDVLRVEQQPVREEGWEELLVCATRDVAQEIPSALLCANTKLRMLCPVEAELEELFMKLMQEGG